MNLRSAVPLRALVLLAALAVLSAALPGSASRLLAAEPARPNILLIYTDDQSHRTVGCYPQALPWVRTPHIDRLAERGIRFAPAYIGTWCMPSRATILTGLHQTGIQSMRRQGKYPGSTYDPEQCPFWPQVFRRHGYVTAHIGKWHTGTDTGFGRDWDFQIVWNRPLLPENSAHYYYDQLLSFSGGPPQRVDGHSTDNYTRWAVEFIRGRHRPQSRPWFLWLCYAAPHAPCTPAPRHLEQFPDAVAPTPADIYPPRPGKPAYMQAVSAWRPGPDGAPIAPLPPAAAPFDDSVRTLSQWVRRYQQCVSSLDEGVAALVEALDETGQRENTLVVFTSDQGFAWGQHGFQDKHGPYDANIASPLIFSMPGTLPERQVCDAQVAGVDLVPTFFRFAGIDLPWPMHGHDLTPLLKDPRAAWPHPALITYTVSTFGDDSLDIPPPKSRRDKVPWYVALCHRRYKYIRTLEAGEIEELYDLAADPEELTNLALDPRRRADLLEFRRTTLDELRRIQARMVDQLPPLRAAD